MDQEIGQRLREIRLQRGLSQRQLARVSGVANATISQIEAGRLNPTVSMLKKVLDGFPISMSEFFADDFEAADRIFYAADELTEIADGGEPTEASVEWRSLRGRPQHPAVWHQCRSNGGDHPRRQIEPIAQQRRGAHQDQAGPDAEPSIGEDDGRQVAPRGRRPAAPTPATR